MDLDYGYVGNAGVNRADAAAEAAELNAFVGFGMTPNLRYNSIHASAEAAHLASFFVA